MRSHSAGLHVSHGMNFPKCITWIKLHEAQAQKQKKCLSHSYVIPATSVRAELSKGETMPTQMKVTRESVMNVDHEMRHRETYRSGSNVRYLFPVGDTGAKGDAKVTSPSPRGSFQ